MKQVNTQEDYRPILSKSFKIAILGSGICLISALLDVLGAIKETDSFDDISLLVGLVGLIVWGAGFIQAGNKVCRLGHKETGVTTTGGALIFWAIVLVAEELFLSEESYVEGTAGYIWTGLEVLPAAIIYFSLKQEGNKEDKYFDTTGMGMGVIAVVTILFFAAMKIGMHAAMGDGISIHHSGDYIYMEQSKMSAIGVWVVENYKLVTIIGTSVISFGYLLCFCSMCSYNDFIKDIEDDKAEADIKQTLAEMSAEYNRSKENATNTAVENSAENE